MRLICQGCGQPVPIPEGYRRNKIQCSCGVICPLPEAARQQAETPSPKRSHSTPKPDSRDEEEAERWLLDDDPPAVEPVNEPSPFDTPAPPERPRPAKKAAVEKKFPCRRCGQLVRRQGECPACNADKMPASSTEPVWWPSVDEPDAPKDEDDGTPYNLDGPDDVKCPECGLMLPPGSVMCVRCGFHQEKREKIVKTYEPIDRAWETNYPLVTRLVFFGCCEAVALGLGLIGVFVGGANGGVFFGSFTVLTLLLAFLMGTYDHNRLRRDGRGRVKLTKTWRACFVPLTPQTIEVRGFEGIISGQHHDVGFVDYLVMFFLLVSGIIPGLIWFYLAFVKVTFHVSLCRDHGYPAYIVYSGWDEAQMKEIAFMLRDATGLRYDEG